MVNSHEFKLYIKHLVYWSIKYVTAYFHMKFCCGEDKISYNNLKQFTGNRSYSCTYYWTRNWIANGCSCKENSLHVKLKGYPVLA